MGVRLMPGTGRYQYRFQLDGKSYSGPTGATTEREALRIERAAKEAARQQHLERSHQQSRDGLTLKFAVGRYLKGQEAKGYLNAKTLQTEIKAFRWIVKTIGPDVLMSDLDLDIVGNMVAERRKLPRTNSSGRVLFNDDGKPQAVSNSYVNRYTWKLLKRVYLAARDEWGVAVKPIRWSSERIALPEAPPRKREIKLEEEGRIISDVNFREGYGAAFRFGLLSGMRKENFTVLKWSEVDFGNREITVWVKSRKGKKQHTIKIDDEMLDLLRGEVGRDPHYVFLYRCQRTRKNPRNGAAEVRGELRPVTYSGFTSWYRTLVARLGFHVTIHDIRRTTGSRIVRRTGNLKAASAHLGHSDIAVTAKHYGHIPTADMLDILNKTARGNKQARDALDDLFKNENGAGGWQNVGSGREQSG